MKTVGAYEAKTHLPELLELVRKGERITITKHGRAVAVLEPVSPVKSDTPARTIAKLKEFRVGRRLGDLSLRDLIDEGRS